MSRPLSSLQPLPSYAADPTTPTLKAGDSYWNTALTRERIYNGTAWQDRIPRPTSDVLANRPAASAAAGQMYQVTDDPTQPTYYSNGTTWRKIAIANKLIDRVEQRIGAVTLTTTAMTTYANVYLNVPIVDSDVRISIDIPYRMYQNGVSAGMPANVTLSLQLIDDLGTIRVSDVLGFRGSSTDPWQMNWNNYHKTVTIDKQAAARYYQLQFQVSTAAMSIAIDPSFAGVGGITLEALAVD